MRVGTPLDVYRLIGQRRETINKKLSILVACTHLQSGSVYISQTCQNHSACCTAS